VILWTTSHLSEILASESINRPAAQSTFLLPHSVDQQDQDTIRLCLNFTIVRNWSESGKNGALDQRGRRPGKDSDRWLHVVSLSRNRDKKGFRLWKNHPFGGPVAQPWAIVQRVHFPCFLFSGPRRPFFFFPSDWQYSRYALAAS
jgi:hypothetical protein